MGTLAGVKMPLEGLVKTQKRVKFFQEISTLITWCYNHDIELMPFCFYRDPETQLLMVKKGRSLVRRSKHQDWLAIDLVLVVGGRLVWKRCKEYDTVGEKWEHMGHRWGGRWKKLNDIYHFEW